MRTVIGSARSSAALNGFTVETYPAHYQPDATLSEHLKFALKYEGVELDFLSRLFGVTGSEPIAKWALEEPTSLHRICDEYGFHATAVHHALRANSEIKIAREQKLAELMLATRRAWVLDTIRKHPEAKRQSIYKRHSAIVRWMELHDREWFAAQLAPSDSGRVKQRPLFLAES